MSEKKIYSSSDIFDSWMYYLRTEAQDVRYLHRDRPELLVYLVKDLFSNGITYEDAKFLKNKVMTALTTEEGRKGKGRYKDWKRCTEEDFAATLASFYVEKADLADEDNNNLKKAKIKKTNKTSVEDGRYHPDNRLITAWAKNKWGQDWTPEINQEAHLVGGHLNLTMQEEVFESKWIQNPNTYPEWYKIACS